MYYNLNIRSRKALKRPNTIPPRKRKTGKRKERLPWQVESFPFQALPSKESPKCMHVLGSDGTKYKGKPSRKQRGKAKMGNKKQSTFGNLPPRRVNFVGFFRYSTTSSSSCFASSQPLTSLNVLTFCKCTFSCQEI